MVNYKNRIRKSRPDIRIHIALGFLNVILFYALYFAITLVYPNFIKIIDLASFPCILFYYIIYSAFIVYLGSILMDYPGPNKFIKLFIHLYMFSLLSYTLFGYFIKFDNSLQFPPNVDIELKIISITIYLINASVYLAPLSLVIVSIFFLTGKNYRIKKQSKIIENQQTSHLSFFAFIQKGIIYSFFIKYSIFILCYACIGMLLFFLREDELLLIYMMIANSSNIMYTIVLFIAFSAVMRRIYSLINDNYITRKNI